MHKNTDYLILKKKLFQLFKLDYSNLCDRDEFVFSVFKEEKVDERISEVSTFNTDIAKLIKINNYNKIRYKEEDFCRYFEEYYNSEIGRNSIKYSSKEIEILVHRNGHRDLPNIENFEIKGNKDEKLGLTYNFSELTQRFIVLSFIHLLYKNSSENEPLIVVSIDHSKIEDNVKDNENCIDIFDLVPRISRIFLRDKLGLLSIKSKSNRSFYEFEKIEASILWECIINEMNIFDYESIRCMFQKGKLKKNEEFDNSRNMNITIPAPSYQIELTPILYYQKANFSTDYVTQYLSYYQVIEFYFKNIRARRLKEIIRIGNVDELTIFVKELSNSKRSSMIYLIDLCIKDPKSLIDSKKICFEYYTKKENLPSFCRATSNLLNQDNLEFAKSISNRVNSVRGSIIHSDDIFLSDSEGFRYNNFNHIEELSREIPLLKILAEFVIEENKQRLEL